MSAGQMGIRLLIIVNLLYHFRVGESVGRTFLEVVGFRDHDVSHKAFIVTLLIHYLCN